MTMDTAYTPTLADRLYVRLWYPVRYTWPHRLQLAIASRAPRWLVYWCVQRAYGQAWGDAGNKTPDELTFEEIVRPWAKPRRKETIR